MTRPAPEFGAPAGHDAPWGYDSRTVHVRFKPFRRRFAYKLFQVFLDIDALPLLKTRLRLLRVNRPGLFSFYEKDHGPKDGSPLRPWVLAQFSQAGVDLQGGPVRLLCFPRMLNYVFNPLSVFFGYGPQGDLRGVIYEVRNTFGESHAYVCSTPLAAHGGDKTFHVSPFFPVSGGYRFRLRAPDAHFALTIENTGPDGRTHLATLNGRGAPLTDQKLLQVFFGLPLMTLGATAAIHWQALFLWLRGARYHAKPKQRQPAVTPVSADALSRLERVR